MGTNSYSPVESDIISNVYYFAFVCFFIRAVTVLEPCFLLLSTLLYTPYLPRIALLSVLYSFLLSETALS